MAKKLISVLLPIYNAEEFLPRTLDSLLCQTYKEFEIIAINDGSKDNSLKLMNEYAKRDKRITVVTQENRGLVKTLNKAASLANGAYLARMDADDLSLPRRFELQIEAFKKHPSAVLIAGGFDVMNEDDEILYHDPVPTEKEELLRALFVRNPIAHGSVMFKAEAFKAVGGYSEECGPTEDYELWSRIVDHGDIVAVSGTIFRWRINKGGITQTKAKLMEIHMKKNLQNFGERHDPLFVSRSYLKERGEYYRESHPQHGVGLKHTMLKDCTSLAMLFLRKKQYILGMRQLLAVALTGRTGVRIVKERLTDTSRYYIRTYANKSMDAESTVDTDLY